MKTHNIIGLLGLLSILPSCSNTGIATSTNSAEGKKLLTRSTHASVPTTYKGEGKRVGRQYFHPPGSKAGIQWADLYESP
jgi:hypothetical protein